MERKDINHTQHTTQHVRVREREREREREIKSVCVGVCVHARMCIHDFNHWLIYPYAWACITPVTWPVCTDSIACLLCFVLSAVKLHDSSCIVHLHFPGVWQGRLRVSEERAVPCGPALPVRVSGQGGGHVTSC